MWFRSILRDVRDCIGSFSRRSFDVRLSGNHREESHCSFYDLNEQSLVIQNSRWENLPPELLFDVLRRLEESESTWPARKHVVACPSVCRSWRTSVCKEIVRGPDICGKLTFPVSLKQGLEIEVYIQCFIKRDKSNLTYHLFLCLSPALIEDSFRSISFSKSLNHSTEFSSARFSDISGLYSENEEDRGKQPLILKNKAPRWHEELQCWCLNFRGRVTVASVKNFQLIADTSPTASRATTTRSQPSRPSSDHDNVTLQFGKVGKDVFSMDYRYPFQAFAVCLSSFDTKLSCE